MNKYLPAILSSFAVIIVTFAVLFSSQKPVNVAQAANVTHLVISEVQILGAVSGEDFIELYNPSDQQIDLSDYRLVKRTSTGDDDDSIVAFEEGDVIAAHGFFLWCNTSLNASLACDSNTSAVVSNDNSVGIRSGALNTGALVDAVTFGVPANPLGEGTSISTAPDTGQSVERKACSSSTADGMSGSDQTNGNAEDSDNNANDFVLRTVSDPQNSSSATEIPGCATETASPSPTASPTDEPLGSPSPTATPTQEPTASPSLTPTVSPTPTATVSPTPEQSPTATATATATATSMPTKTPKPNSFFPTLVCGFQYKTFNFGWFSFQMPFFSCRSVR